MTKTAALSLAAPQRLLIRGVNWLGDAVMSMPALQRLRECLPSTHLTVLTPEKLQDLYLMQPAVNGVITFPSDARVREVARRIGRDQFDVGLIFPNSPRSALELWLAKIPVRIGYARPWRRWLLTHPVFVPPMWRPMRKRSVGEIRRLIASPDQRSMAEPLPGAHHIHQYLGLAAAFECAGAGAPARLDVTAEQDRKSVV